MLCLRGAERRARPRRASHRAPSRQVACRAHRTVRLHLHLRVQPAEEPDEMRVVRFYAPRDVRVEDAPEPAAGPGELVIRVRNCSVCGTDAKIWRSGHPDLRPPRVLGHEVAGEVVEVGEGAGGWSRGRPGPGDRGHPRRHLPRVPPRLGERLPQPGADRLPPRRRLRRADAGPGQGAGRRRRQPRPRRAVVRRGVGGRAAELRRSTARSWPGSARARPWWWSAPGRSAACTSGWPGPAARPGCS